MVDYLATATQTTQLIFKKHQGGHTQAVEELIHAIESSAIGRIEIKFDSYAISAAAFIFAYFVYFANSTKVVVKTDHPLCLVYHKPRIQSSSYFLFPNNLIQRPDLTAQYNYLLRIARRFDDVFHAMWAKTQIAPYMIDVYNNNGDVALVLPKGIQSHV